MFLTDLAVSDTPFTLSAVVTSIWIFSKRSAIFLLDEYINHVSLCFQKWCVIHGNFMRWSEKELTSKKNALQIDSFILNVKS